MIYFQTLSKAVNNYTDKGYTFSFDFSNRAIKPSDWVIVQTHRFEGYSDPSDNTILYVLEHKNGIDKGIIIDAYGAGQNASKSEWLKGVRRVFLNEQGVEQ